MKIVTVSISALALSGSLAFAQISTSPGGTAGGGTAPGTVSPGTGSSTIAPPGSPAPSGSFGPSPTFPSGVPSATPNPFTTGSGSNLGPSPEDLTRRYNRQDLTRPGASNPQDLSTGGGSGGSGVGGSSGSFGSSGGFGGSGSFGGGIAPGVTNIAAPER